MNFLASLKKLWKRHAILAVSGMAAFLGVPGPSEAFHWKIHWRVEKFHGASLDEIAATGEKPYEVVEYDKNLAMYGGVSCIWETLIGNGTSTADQVLTYFSNARAAIGVGDSSTAAAATQTDLQASSNKLRKGMDATYPTHTDGTSSGSASIVFKSSFTTGEANFAWNEVGVFNTSTAATGRMLNRVVQSFGTKTTGTWTMQVTITIS